MNETQRHGKGKRSYPTWDFSVSWIKNSSCVEEDLMKCSNLRFWKTCLKFLDNDNEVEKKQRIPRIQSEWIIHLLVTFFFLHVLLPLIIKVIPQSRDNSFLESYSPNQRGLKSSFESVYDQKDIKRGWKLVHKIYSEAEKFARRIKKHERSLPMCHSNQDYWNYTSNIRVLISFFIQKWMFLKNLIRFCWKHWIMEFRANIILLWISCALITRYIYILQKLLPRGKSREFSP